MDIRFAIWCVTIKYLYMMTSNSAKKTTDHSANQNKHSEKDNRAFSDFFDKIIYGRGSFQFFLIVSPVRLFELGLVCFWSFGNHLYLE